MNTTTHDELQAHKLTHTKSNSWWLNDARGIPLSRVCEECVEAVEATYKPEVLGTCGRYEDAVEERIEENDP